MNNKGQTIVETAIILPILLILVLGIFEFGRAMYIKNTLNNAARAGARAAVVLPPNSTSSPEGLVYSTDPITVLLNRDCSYATPTANRSIYITVCNSLYNGISKDKVSVTVQIKDLDNSNSLNSGDEVDVLVSWADYPTLFSKAIPAVGGTDVTIMGSGLTLTGEASMRYE